VSGSEYLYSLAAIKNPSSILLTKETIDSTEEWSRIYRANSGDNMLAISSDESALFFLEDDSPLLIYKVDTSNGDLLKKFEVSGIFYHSRFSKLIVVPNKIFFAGKMSGKD
jgi:hypothetical protein